MDASVSPSPPPERPRSDVSAFVGLAGLAGMFAWIAIARHWPGIVDLAGLPGPRQPLSGPWSAFACMVATGLPMVLWSVWVDKVHRNPSTGIDWSRRRPLASYAHVSVVKLAGLWATWAVLAAFFWLARWYWDGQYLFAMEIFQLAIGPLVVLSIPYVLWLDSKLDEPRDGVWHFGALLLGQAGWEREAVLRHWRAWAIKAFFSAFMLSILPPGFAAIVNADLPAILGNPVRTGVLLIELLFVVDVQIGTVGYLLTLRPLDAHIRSGNPFIGGWVAALICYPPVVWGFMGGTGILAYEVDTPGWSHWLGGVRAAFMVVGRRAGRADRVLQLGDDGLRHPLFQPHLSWRGHQRAVSLHPPPGLSVEEPVLVVLGHAVPGRDRRSCDRDPQLLLPRLRQRDLLLARADRRGASAGRGREIPRLFRLDGRERRDHRAARASKAAGSPTCRARGGAAASGVRGVQEAGSNLLPVIPAKAGISRSVGRGRWRPQLPLG